jgi:type VI secretion system secreted protein VgrG
VNQTYVLQSVSHAATQESYTNSFTAFSADVPFRPPRHTAKPRISGTQTAIVVGKAGEEIWTDKYGRVKVQFHWDQLGKNDENSSCWIRVDYGWAGKQWGGIFLPRIGQEVIVSYLEGDPDRPLITGAVYNAEQTFLTRCPTNRPRARSRPTPRKAATASTRFASRTRKTRKSSTSTPRRIRTSSSSTTAPRRSCTTRRTTIKQDRSTTIEEGNDTYVVSKGNRDVQVDTGNETYEVKGTRDLTVTGNETHTNKANFTHNREWQLFIEGNRKSDD